MKNKIKGLLALVLSVLIGQAWAADPVATWTDFRNPNSGEYTLTADMSTEEGDGKCTVNDDGSITLGGAGLTVPYSGSGVTVVMEVSNINADDHTLIDYTLKGNNNHISLFTWSKNTSGATLEQWWNNLKYSTNEESGSATWPTNREERRTVALTYAAGEGTTTYINGVMLINNNSLMSSGENGKVVKIRIGSYNGTDRCAVNMKIHSLRLYSSKLTDQEVNEETNSRFTYVGGLDADNVVTNGNAIHVASEKTVRMIGFLNFTNGVNSVNAGGTLDVISGKTTFCAGDRAIKGTVNIMSGATLVASSTDALDYDNTSVFNVYGTLDMSTYRWTLFDGNTFNLYAGCTVTGAGESRRTAWEVCENNTVNILSNGENDSVTIDTPIRLRDSQDILTFNFNEDAAAVVCSIGGVIDGSGKLSVAASGTMELTGANTYAGGTEIAEGATLKVPKMSALGAANTEVNVAKGGKVTVTSTGNVTEDDGVARAVFVGEGTVEFNGAGYYVLPNNFKAPAYLINNQAGNLTIATDGTYDVGSYSGEKYFRMDYNQRGERAFVFTQRADATIASDIVQMFGDVNNGQRLTDVTVKGVDGATLTLSGAHNNIHFRTLTIDTTGSVNLAGGWKGDVDAYGIIAGMGTIGGKLKLQNGATLDVSAGALNVTGEVWVMNGANNTASVMLPENYAVDTPIVSCSNAEAVAADLSAKMPSGYKCVADGNTVKLAVAKKTNFVVTVGENAVNCETFAEALNALGSAGGSLQVADDADDAALLINEPIVITADAIIDLNGKTLTGSTYPVIRIQNGANVTIKNGAITNNDYVFVLGASDQTSAGNLTIESGTYTGVTTVASVTKGTLTIKGGIFAVDMVDYGATYLLNCYDATYKTGDAKIVVKGGTFNGFDPSNNTAEGAGTNFCAEGYEATLGDDGYWTVAEAKPVVAQIGETPYETLQAACDDANEGDIVQLIADTEENCVVKEGFNGTIDLGGNTLTGRIFSKSATMTIQNGTIVRKWIGDDKSSSNGAIEIQGGSLTLQDTLSVQILADNVTHLIRLRNSASCVINGGNYSITSTGTDATMLYPSSSGTTMIVNGGTFTYDTTNASMPSIANIYGTLTVNGGTFNAYGQSYLFNIDNVGGKTYVKNGLFNCSSSGRLTYNNPKPGDPYGYLEFLGGKYACNPETTRTVIAEGYASGLLEDNYYIVSKAYAVGLTVDTAKATVDGLNDVHACGSIVSFTVTPVAGYKVTSVKLGTDELTAVDGNYTFKMPAEAVTITVTTEAASTFDVTIGGDTFANADALKAEANSTTTMTVPEGTWTAEGNILKKDGEAYVEFADYYTVVVNGTTVTLKLNKPVIGESAEGADDAFTVTADAVTIKITNYNSALKYGVRTAADINGLKTAEIAEVETDDGVITLTKSGDSAFFEVVVSDVDFPVAE